MGESHLEIGLPYLLKHNREHEKDIQKWIQRAKEAHQDAVAADLQNVYWDFLIRYPHISRGH